MNAKEFIQGVIKHMRSGTEGAISFIGSPPPGRKPLPKGMEMHNWYRGLSNIDKEMVNKLINEVTEGTVYGLLMVLDHKMFVEGYGEKGVLELHYRDRDGKAVRLNPLGGENGKDLEYYFKEFRDSGSNMGNG